MRSAISFLTLLVLKGLSNIFYRFEVGWPTDKKINWKEVRLIVLLNHTSLFEVLYIGILPISFLRRLSLYMALPGADKTLSRPFVGLLFKLFSANLTPVTRKRDDSWQQFLDSFDSRSIGMIAAEGRMKRPTGLDLEGKKMTVRGGVIDILQILDSGQMGIAYSGGLHHVQIPGEGWPKPFKKLKMDVEVFDIAEYKASFHGEIGSREWRKEVLADLQHRLETKPPVADGEVRGIHTEKTIFKTNGAFIITGRGLVLSGSIISGVIHTGDYIIMPKDGDILEREITGIEFMRTTSSDKTGVLVKCESAEEMQELRNWDLEGKEFEVISRKA